MDSNLKECNYKFPVVATIMLIYLFSTLSIVYSCVTSVLALYLVDVLQFEETQSVTYVHTFVISMAIFALFGGILSDSWLGRFKSILCFNTILICGLLLLTVSSVRDFNLPLRELSVAGLILVSLGYGAVYPCSFAFGGDQFTLPQQSKQLSMFFVFIFTGTYIGSLINFFITPILRKDLMCFQELTCYPLVFLIPTILLTLTTVTMLLTKRFYLIKKPVDNVTLDVIKCVSRAMYKKLKSREKHLHWLDYASDKYDKKLLKDIKSASRVLRLFLLMPIYWALYDMKNSIWTFQASRMDGEFRGYLIKPDQVQVIVPVYMIVFSPIIHTYVFPVLEKYLFLRTPLRKITVGCFVSALAYTCSGVLELNLESTYAVIPSAGTAQLRIFNTLNCDASIIVDEQKLVLRNLSKWENVSIPTSGKKFLKYTADYRNCKILGYDPKVTHGELEINENQATSWALTSEGLTYSFIDNVDKSTSGNPLVRALVYIDQNFAKENVTLKFVHNDDVLKEITVPKKFRKTELTDVVHKRYDLYLNDQLVESNYPISVGGVYTILGHVSASTTVARVVTVTQPNSVHIFWIIPQQVLVSTSDIIIQVLMTEFAFSQSPLRMKTLLQSCWQFSSVFGNLIIIMFTELKPIKRRAIEFFLFAILMLISMIVFAITAYFYKYKEYSSNEENTEKKQKNACSDVR